MNECVECKEPDYPLDDKTGLCYTCWQIAGMEEEEWLYVVLDVKKNVRFNLEAVIVLVDVKIVGEVLLDVMRWEDDS